MENSHAPNPVDRSLELDRSERRARLARFNHHSDAIHYETNPAP